jgi:hypothetical protein
MSDYDYERFRLHAILENKSVNQLLAERITSVPFPAEVEEAFDQKFTKDFYKLCE